MDSVETQLRQLRQSALENRLVIICGAGTSIALTQRPELSWSGLVRSAFEYATTKGLISEAQSKAWNVQLASSDLDDLLSAAEFASRKLKQASNQTYGRWLEREFSSLQAHASPLSRALKLAANAKIPIATLNYDTLLEDILSRGSLDFDQRSNVASWLRRESDDILHIHGVWKSPSTCVLGLIDYHQLADDEVRNLFQRSLSTLNRILFIGCGGTFGDPNFSALVEWLGSNFTAGVPQHYALVPSHELERRNTDPAWRGFVEPIPFGDTADLGSFLSNLLSNASVASISKTARRSRAKSNTSISLDVYRTSLLRDCGQMTIEGVRADMDTAQRRFDLERLFVPLQVHELPPDIPPADPERDTKLQKWAEENSESRPFGSVLKQHKRVALLALPGGGKTLLLKRLAVAYADPTRRKRSADHLPELKMIPVLIRCREWREYIRRPILEIIGNIPEIAGLEGASALRDDLLPHLRSGRVLLLVDGLDEIHNDADRTTFVEHLESFLDRYPRVRLIVTSREAGFSLVAPSISRFCARYRIAPLSDESISNLCDYWHDLMSGGLEEAKIEADSVAKTLQSTPSLRRLAENPLLLTMLLVVKHGAGRLPPDKVSLYERAVDVLLDTWNIKGHEPLKLKEAIPQLACIAYEMMKSGKQTATQRELLKILEDARDTLPQLRRYATGTPDDFLRRVELRSSLLLEGGHTVEGIRTVPFYQFRHLTFQEYLAAVAAVEGHHMAYRKGESVLAPLRPHLLSEEWKEVIPMAAVLGRKQSEPLIAALTKEGAKLNAALIARKPFRGKDDWESAHKMPAPIARLVQCLVEEAEIPPDILTQTLQVVAAFARGCQSADNWSAVSRGPYGEELIHQASEVYRSFAWPRDAWTRNTLALLCALRQPQAYWFSSEGQRELVSQIESSQPEVSTRGVLTCAGAWWGDKGSGSVRSTSKFSEDVRRAMESALFASDRPTAHAATWMWGVFQRDPKSTRPSNAILDRLLELWMSPEAFKDMQSAADFAIINASKQSEHWIPKLREEDRDRISGAIKLKVNNEGSDYRSWAALVVATRAKDDFDENDLKKYAASIRKSSSLLSEELSWLVEKYSATAAKPRRRS